MSATKGKMPVTIKKDLIRLLEERAHHLKSNKSALLKQALTEKNGEDQWLTIKPQFFFPPI